MFTSMIVEFTQYILKIGVADFDDIILNTFGACLGVVLLNWFQKSKHPLIRQLLNPS